MVSEGKRLAHYSYLSVAYLLVKIMVILMILTVIYNFSRTTQTTKLMEKNIFKTWRENICLTSILVY